MASAEKPEILLLSLAYLEFLDEIYAPLFNRLLEVAHVKRAKSASGALRTLADTNFKAIIITDQGLTESNPETREVVAKIKAYIENGGRVILGLHFPCFMPIDKFSGFFESFGLPWKNGDYHRTTFQINPSGLLPESVELSSLPKLFSMKAVHIKNAEPQEKICIPIEGAVTQSHVFPPEYVDQAQAGAVGAKLGRCYLIYCGDVNGEKGSNQLILALCGF